MSSSPALCACVVRCAACALVCVWSCRRHTDTDDIFSSSRSYCTNNIAAFLQRTFSYRHRKSNIPIFFSLSEWLPLQLSRKITIKGWILYSLMERRRLQSAGGAGGTLFSALMLVIIVICFVSLKSQLVLLRHQIVIRSQVIKELDNRRHLKFNFYLNFNFITKTDNLLL